MMTLDQVKDLGESIFQAFVGAPTSEKMQTLKNGYNQLYDVRSTDSDALLLAKKLRKKVMRAQLDLVIDGFEKTVAELGDAFGKLGVAVAAANTAADTMPLKRILNGAEEFLDVVSASNELADLLSAEVRDPEAILTAIKEVVVEANEMLDMQV